MSLGTILLIVLILMLIGAFRVGRTAGTGLRAQWRLGPGGGHHHRAAVAGQTMTVAHALPSD